MNVSMLDWMHGIDDELKDLEADVHNMFEGHDQASLGAAAYHISRVRAEMNNAIRAYREAVVYGEAR